MQIEKKSNSFKLLLSNESTRFPLKYEEVVQIFNQLSMFTFTPTAKLRLESFVEILTVDREDPRNHQFELKLTYDEPLSKDNVYFFIYHALTFCDLRDGLDVHLQLLKSETQ